MGKSDFCYDAEQLARNLDYNMGLELRQGALRPVCGIGDAIAGASDDAVPTSMPVMPLPAIEFDLQEAGTLALSQSFQVPASMCPAQSGTGVAGSGAWTVHAASATTAANHDTAAKKVHNAIMRAIALQIHGGGYFYQPFMLRYAVRLADGSYAAVSSPVMMAPCAQPPCISLYSSTISDDTATIMLSGTQCPFSRLRYRVLQGFEEQYENYVAGIDIFCTQQMLTYLDDEPGTDGIVQRDDIRCWQMLDDFTWMQRMLSCGDFYKVASLSWRDIAPSANFVPLAIGDTSCKSLKTCAKFPQAFINPTEMLPAAALRHGDQIIAAGGSVRLPSPMPLRTMVPHAENSHNAARVTVLGKISGRNFATSCACVGTMQEARYLYTDIAGAYAMVIEADGNQYYLPLTAHEALPGAYWWGGLSPVLASMDANSVLPPALETMPCGSDVRIYSSDNDYTGGKSVSDNCCLGEIIALKQSLRPMSSGQFGQFPIYIFSTQGIWVLPKEGSAPVMISHEAAISAKAIAATDSGVAYLAGDGLRLLNGSKIERVEDSPEIDDTARLLVSGDRIIVYGCDRDLASVYNVATKQWYTSMMESIADTVQVKLMTKPIRCGGTDRPKRTEVIGQLPETGCEIIVYGSNDLRHWHAVASARAGFTDLITGSRYRFVTVHFECQMEASDYILTLELI